MLDLLWLCDAQFKIFAMFLFQILWHIGLRHKYVVHTLPPPQKIFMYRRLLNFTKIIKENVSSFVNFPNESSYLNVNIHDCNSYIECLQCINLRFNEANFKCHILDLYFFILTCGICFLKKTQKGVHTCRQSWSTPNISWKLK